MMNFRESPAIYELIRSASCITHLQQASRLLPILIYTEARERDMSAKRVTANLDDDTLLQVDEEAKRQGLSRAEMLSKLTRNGLSGGEGPAAQSYSNEIQNQVSMMQRELALMQRALEEKKDDINYYRSEIARLTQEISSLSRSIVEIKALPPGREETFDALADQMKQIRDDIAALKNNPASDSFLIKYQKFINAGMIVLLFIIGIASIKYAFF